MQQLLKAQLSELGKDRLIEIIEEEISDAVVASAIELDVSDDMKSLATSMYLLFHNHMNSLKWNTEVDAIEGDEVGVWKEAEHKHWIEFTRKIIHDIQIETIEEMATCVERMSEIIISTDKLKAKDEKAFSLFILYMARKARRDNESNT